ncbi:MAG: hypothetical protein WC586_06655 [Methanoregula sp.]
MRTNTRITGNAEGALRLTPAGFGSNAPAEGIAIEHLIPVPERPGCSPGIILHDGEGSVEQKRFSRSNPLVYEAMRILKAHGYLPVRVTESTLPVNLIGLKKARSLLIHVIRSRRPVPSAAVLHVHFKDVVENLCCLAGSIQYQIMIWVYSPACSWRYYLVYPGGLRRDLDFPGSLDK